MLVTLPCISDDGHPIADVPGAPVPGGVVLQALFDQIDRAGITYCLLRGLDQLRLREDAYEIDLLLSPDDLERFGTVVARAGFEPMPAWGNAPHFFFVGRDSGLGAWIKLDVVTDLRYGRFRALRAGVPAEYLSRRRRQDGVYTLAPADEFVHLLLHAILDKGVLGPRYKARLRTLLRSMQADPEAFASFVAEFDSCFAPALTYAEAAVACHQAVCAWIAERRHSLVRQLLRHQSGAAWWRAVRGWTARRLRPLQILQKRRGLVVALLGPDGAGKTTVAAALSRSSPLAMRRVYMGYGRCDGEKGSWALRGLWRLASATPTGPSGVWRRTVLCLRWAARIALQMSRSAVVRVRRAAGQVIVLDRSVYDLWLEPGRQQQYQSPARRAVRWWLTVISPAPDLVVVLDVPAEILWQRKTEWPIDVLAGQRAAYRELAQRLPQGVVIDGSRDLASVSNGVADEIWQRRSEVRPPVAPPETPAAMATAASKDVTRQQLRGSSLLLSGRFVALGVAALGQILLIRYLAPDDFGRWMYALAAVAVLKSVAGLGVDRSVTRFAAFYYERGDRARLLGVMVLTIVAVLAAGGAMIVALHTLPDQVMRLVQNQSEPMRLLFILIFLVPLEAMDSLLLGVFACFGNARAIFFRRYIVGPGLRLAAVLFGVLSHASVVVLAYGYVIAAALGILIYGRLLWQLCRDAGLFKPIVRVTLPAKEVFSFTLPMLVADVAIALMYGAGALALGYTGDMRAVAVFAAALPLALLNQTVMRSFSLLYTSSASKLLAKGDLKGINELYWQTAVWLAVLTFPIFAVTFSAAGALTGILYGSQYAAAGPILALLALGEYVNVALGFNGLTLRVLNRAGYLTAISAGAAVVTVLLVFWAAPRYGAWGVAVATAASMVVHNVFKQMGLRLATGVTLFDRRYAGFYLALVGASAALLLANWWLRDSPLLVLVFTGVASLLMVFLCRRILKIAEVFPEIRRVPILRALLA